ncbi:MBL fold metallo-hydrolase [Candidatus Bathyarchaeota archaeon]|nr:MBL fold metallo-hydrolase [Candidatus Bathyarchaeota archaeon]
MLKAYDSALEILLNLKDGGKVSITKVADHIFMIDVEAARIRNFVASYIVRGESVVIIETGPTSSIHNLVGRLLKLGIKPDDVSYVAVSHIHLDHGGGVGSLIKHFPNAKVLVHQRGVLHLANPEKLWQQSKMALGAIAEIYGKPEPVPPERMVAAQDGMTLNVGGGITLKVIETLGHASHHLSYYEPLSKGIFTGDAAGIYISELDVIVPTTPPPFRLDIALNSLNKLASLKPMVLYYTHFGKALNAAGKLEMYAKQLKLWAKTAKEALNAGEDLGAISRRIVENDDAVKKAEGYIKTHMVLRETVLRESVLGIIEFVKNFGIPA